MSSKFLAKSVIALTLMTGLTGCLGLGADFGVGSDGKPDFRVKGRAKHNVDYRDNNRREDNYVRIQGMSTGNLSVPLNGRASFTVSVDSNTGVRLSSRAKCASTSVLSVGPGRQTVQMEAYGLKSGNCQLDILAEGSTGREDDKVKLSVTVY